jgi:DNA-binding SARP family transcriptional activator
MTAAIPLSGSDFCLVVRCSFQAGWPFAPRISPPWCGRVATFLRLAHHSGVELRILGPLEVVENGRTLTLGSRKQRALLALLALHAGKVVSRDRLIDDLWHGEPPAAAETTLRSHISRLRSTLGASRLLTRPPGYVLVLAPEELDASRCERLLAQGRTALAQGRAFDAAACLRSALALWRGSPLADVAYEAFAQGEIGRLEELQLALLEERVETDLALGRHADLIGELEGLVAEHPLRERLRGQLMLALYRSGRQAEALESYQQARHALTEELGLEPGEALKDVQRAILAHDPALEVPRRAEPEVAPPQGAGARGAAPFVGREAELQELLRGLDAALTAEGRLCLISGDPGIGKSSLVEQLAARARERGAEVLVGRCWEAGGAPAYWPWVQALRTYVRDRDRDLLRAQLGRGAPDLAQILPELNELYGELTAPPSGDPEGARFRLFEEVASFLRTISLAQPLVLVLDDLHAADTPSLLLLQYLADALAGTRLLVIGVYRDVDPTLREPLAETLVELRRRPVTRHLQLAGLAEHEIHQFVSSTTGREPAAHLVSALHRATEGNPLFVEEVVRLLTSEEALEQVADADTWRRIVPESVRAVIRRRLERLSENCRLVLVLAAVLGREFDLAALERVTEVTGDHLLEVLDESARERVVTDIPGQPGRMRFAHVLVRDTLYEELTPGRRVQLHRRVGDALERLYANNLEPHLAELAYHFYESARPAVAEKALAYARRAAERSLRLLAYEEAARLFAVALQLLDDIESPDGAIRCELLLDLGDAYARAGNTPRSKQIYREAARTAETLRLPDQLGRAALGYGGRLIWEASREDEHLVPLLEKALVALGDEDSTLRVRLLGRLAGGPLRDASADAGRRRALGAQALEMARRIGDPATLAYALSGYINSRVSPASVPDQVVLAKELVDVAFEMGDIERVIEGHQYHLELSLELGDMSSANADLDALTRWAAELGQPAQKWLAGAYRTMLALLAGRFGEAERLIAETRSVGERAQSWSAGMTHDLQLYVLRREQGRVEEMRELVRCAASDNPTYPVWRCVLANMLSEVGEAVEARAELEALAANGFAEIPFDEEWEVSLCLLAETATRLRDSEHAAKLYDLLLPYADRVTVSYVEISLGPVARYLGLLASTIDRFDEAVDYFGSALELSARIGARPWLARTQDDYGHLLLRRAQAGNAERADELLDRARATYAELGMSPSSPIIAGTLARSTPATEG